MRGVPPEVAAALDSHDLTRDAVLVLGLPEHQVDLPGGGHPSQNDLWALLRAGSTFISLSVEGKAGESLGEPIEAWLRDATPKSGKPERLAALRAILGIETEPVNDLRYQLLHRAASALIKAEEFGAMIAVMIVQSFGGELDGRSLTDFERFANVMHCQAQTNSLAPCDRSTPRTLLLGWVTTSPAGDGVVAKTI